MARTDRLFRLMALIRALPAPVTAARLAELTEVSPRSLYRDIAALRAAGARIEGAPGLGYVLAEDPALPPQMFTRIEVEALVLGLSHLRGIGDEALVKAADDALAKVIASLPERVQRQALHVTSRVVRLNPPRRIAPAHIALIRQASWDEAEVELRYQDLSGAWTRRKIWPLAIIFFEQALICAAYCCLRQEFRRFHIDRMADVALSGASFRPQRVGLLREFIAKARASDAAPSSPGRA